MNVVEIFSFYEKQRNEEKIIVGFQNNWFVSILSSIHLKMLLDSPNYCPKIFELML